MCSEFAKELVWENRTETFKDELYIFSKQNHRLFRCDGKVRVILTDRPLIMSVVYNRFYGDSNNISWNNAYEQIVQETFNQYNNYNVFLNRVKPFNSNGRNETEKTAREFDEKFIKSLDELKIDYDVFNGEEESVQKIGEQILSLLGEE